MAKEMFEGKLKAIVFDVGGVLVMDAPKYFMGELQIKKDIPIQESLKIWRKYWGPLKLGKISEDDFWKKFIDDLLIKEDPDMLLQDFKDMIRLFLVPHDKVLEYAKSLKTKFKLGILSNSVKEWVAYHREHYKVDEGFDAAIYSCDVHSVKPEKHIYEVLLSKLGLQAEECVFIDNHDRNLETAKTLGFHTILYKNLDQLKIDIEKAIEEVQ